MCGVSSQYNVTVVAGGKSSTMATMCVVLIPCDEDRTMAGWCAGVADGYGVYVGSGVPVAYGVLVG